MWKGENENNLHIVTGNKCRFIVGDKVRTMKRLMVRAAKFYVIGGMLYGFWNLTFINLRICGLSACMPDAFPKTLMIVAVAIGRGILWLPNLLLSLRDGNFVDEWLLLASALAGFTPQPATQADYDKLDAMLNNKLQAIGTIIFYNYECGGAPPHLMALAQKIDRDLGEDATKRALELATPNYFNDGKEQFCAKVKSDWVTKGFYTWPK
jgi:hypothetical protein